MKIQFYVSQSDIPCFSKKTAEGFEKIIHPTGNQSGQAFYWQHQDHLQPSALQFGKELFSRKPDEKQTITESRPNHALFDDRPAQCIHTRSPDFVEKSLPVTALLNQTADITIKFTNLAEETSAMIIPSSDISPKTTPLKFIKPERDIPSKSIHPIFQKQRIYLQKNNLELSMNLPQFEQKSVYRETIHQLIYWFTQHGINIKKFMINGVKQ